MKPKDDSQLVSREPSGCLDDNLGNIAIGSAKFADEESGGVILEEDQIPPESPLLQARSSPHNAQNDEKESHEMMTCPVDMGQYSARDMFGLSCGHLQCKYCI